MNPLRAGFALGLLVFLGCAPTASEAVRGQEVPAEAHPVFEQLAGDWVGVGSLMGRTAAFDMRWEMQSNGFVRLVFANAFVGDDEARTPVLSSEATYLVRGDSAVGVWLDDRPQRITLTAVLTDSSVVTTWTAPSETGRTEYIVRSGAVRVRDWVEVDGALRMFGEATYRRRSP